MAKFQLRFEDDEMSELHEQVKALAERDHRSMNGQILYMLERQVELDAIGHGYDRPLQPGETRDVGGGNSIHLHDGPDCPCGHKLGGNGGPTSYVPLQGPLR